VGEEEMKKRKKQEKKKKGDSSSGVEKRCRNMCVRKTKTNSSWTSVDFVFVSEKMGERRVDPVGVGLEVRGRIG
jgi:hypothetical protein